MWTRAWLPGERRGDADEQVGEGETVGREEGLLGRRARLKGKAKGENQDFRSAEGTRQKWVVCVGEEEQKKEGRNGGGRSEGGEVGAPK